MNLYADFVAVIAFLAWLAFADIWRRGGRSARSWFMYAMVGQVALFTTTRTLAFVFGFVSAPTIFFSAWGGMILLQVIFLIWFAVRKGM